MSKYNPLSRHDRRVLFANEYLKDLNATRAYKRAGYKARGHGAEVAASRLLRNVEVQRIIAEAQAKVVESLQVDAEMVLKEAYAIATTNMLDVVDEQGRLRPLETIPLAKRCAISEVVVKDGKIVRVKLCSKIGALELLFRHFGLLGPKPANSPVMDEQFIFYIPDNGRSVVPPPISLGPNQNSARLYLPDNGRCDPPAPPTIEAA